MDQGFDKGKPPSTSYRETFRRHRKLLCTPIVLGILGAAFFVFSTSSSYKSTASLWIDTTAPAPSSIGSNTGTPLAQPPSTAEQGILGELLTTRSFASAVASSSLLGKSAGSSAATSQNAVAALAGGQITENVAGNQVLQISYTAPSQAMAESVLGAVVTQLRDYTDRLSAQHNQAVLGYDRAQVKSAQTALAAARNSVSAYQAQHPGVNETDPNYASLVSGENNDATQLAQANTALSQVAGSNTSGWSIQVIDPASVATAATAKKSKMAEVIFAGALAGLLISFLAVVAMTPAKKEAWEDELPLGNPRRSDLPPADPFRAAPPVVATPSAHSSPGTSALGERRLSLGHRRFQLRAQSAPTDEQ